MALDIDTIIDRRRLRRKISVWRIAALVAVAVAVVAVLAATGAFKGVGAPSQYIARVPITGVITEDKRLLTLLDQIGKDKAVKGVVLTIDSPGGTTVGGEAIYQAVRKLAEKKPVATSVGTLAASAGYMIAAGSDHIVARRSSIVGSIGVIFQYPQAKGLLDKIGVSMEEVKSSPLKAEPSPFKTPPPGTREALQELINDTYIWFVDLVAERRKLAKPEALKVSDGRVFSGKRGLDLKLVDALGGEEVAKDWLVDEKGVSKDLKLVTRTPPRRNQGLLFSNAASVWLMQHLGFQAADVKSLPHALPDALQKGLGHGLFLDGLLSLWQPAG
ncbi:MAG: signal peptide peptidase SppA [Pseudomonadota bacterium]